MTSTPSSPSSRRGSLGIGLAAAAIQAALVLLTTGAKVGTDDTDIYYRYATRALRGEMPYRDFRVEYPPLALPLFLAPAAASRGLAGFKFAFAFEMLACNAAAVLLVAARVGRREGLARVPWRLAWYTVPFLILSRLLVTRHDAAPMLLGFGATLWWASGRGALGGFAASLGALVKVYPAVVAVLASARDLNRPGPGRLRGPVAFALTSILGFAGWLSIGGVRGVSESLRYHLGRGFEYGSLYSGAQMLAAKVLGSEIIISRDHASFSTITPWSGPLLAPVFFVQVAALLVVRGVFARRGMGEVVRYSGAAVLAFIVAGKVFSPQYLIWLLPYIAVLEGPIAPRGHRLFVATCVATLLAPAALNYLPRTSLWVILAYNARNLLIVWLLILLCSAPEPNGPTTGRRAAEPGPIGRAKVPPTGR